MTYVDEHPGYDLLLRDPVCGPHLLDEEVQKVLLRVTLSIALFQALSQAFDADLDDGVEADGGRGGRWGSC